MALLSDKERVPTQLADLLERPLVAFLATTRPDGGVQNNPMWFAFDGTYIELSHTSDRKKFRNLSENPGSASASPIPRTSTATSRCEGSSRRPVPTAAPSSTEHCAVATGWIRPTCRTKTCAW